MNWNPPVTAAPCQPPLTRGPLKQDWELQAPKPPLLKGGVPPQGAGGIPQTGQFKEWESPSHHLNRLQQAQNQAVDHAGADAEDQYRAGHGEEL